MPFAYLYNETVIKDPSNHFDVSAFENGLVIAPGDNAMRYAASLFGFRTVWVPRR